MRGHSVPPHTRHKHLKKRLCAPYSHLSLPTDHTSASYRLQPWPRHTLLPAASRPQPPPQPRADRGDRGEEREIRVLGRIDTQQEFQYTARVHLEQLEEFAQSRLLRSFEVARRLLRPLNHVSGPRALTPPPGPLPVRPSQVLLDAQTLIGHSRDAQQERERRFLRRVRQCPLLPPGDRDKPSQELAAFSATCLGHQLRQPLASLSSLQRAWEQSRQKLKNASRINLPRPVGTLETECKHRNAPMMRPHPTPEHLLVVTSTHSPASPRDILSLCSLREGLRTLKDKSNKRVK